MSKLLTVVNPNHYFDLDLFDLEDAPDQHDVQGEFVIIIQNKNQEDLFNFNFYAYPGRHADISDFEVSKQPTLEQLNYQNRIRKYKANLQTKPTFEDINSIAEGIWLSSKDSQLITQYIRHPLYKLLNQKLEDNDSNIRFLKHFIESSPQLNPEMTPLHKEQLKQITRNVLKSLSWDDPATFENIKSEIGLLLSSDQTNQNLAEVFAYDEIQKNFSPLTFKDFEEGDKKDIFTGIKYLTIRDSIQKEFTFFQNEKLKKLLVQSASRLETLVFTHKLTTLSRLTLIQANIREIKGLHYLPALQDLILDETKNLKKLEFTKEMKNLSRLSLEESSIDEIQGLHYLSGLKDLNLSRTKNFHTLEFTQKMENISYLKLEYSNIVKIQGFDHLPILQNLNLLSTKNLEYLEFTQEMKYLSELILEFSNIKVIRGLHYLSALKELNLKQTKMLETIEFVPKTNTMQSLKFENENKNLILILTNSSIRQRSQIQGIEHLNEDKIIW